MSIRFRGGESLQRGRGIGGLLRLVKSVFSPIVKSFGTTALKAVTSKTGKKVLGSIKDQAISSAVNMASDVIKGNDLRESFQNEVCKTCSLQLMSSSNSHFHFSKAVTALAYITAVFFLNKLTV